VILLFENGHQTRYFTFEVKQKRPKASAQTGRKGDWKRDSRQEQTAAESDSINGPTAGTVPECRGNVHVFPESVVGQFEI